MFEIREKILPIIVFGLSHATGSISVSAQESEGGIADLLSMSGDCYQLIVFDKALPCKGVVINAVFESGRTSFSFFNDAEDGGAISFSGTGAEQVLITENRVFQPIDSLSYDEERLDVVGACTFDNPYLGRARIECVAFLPDGNKVGAFFESDGSPPEF